eukprot:9896715-Alexandrium_andersonii.AAC.1
MSNIPPRLIPARARVGARFGMMVSRPRQGGIGQSCGVPHVPHTGVLAFSWPAVARDRFGNANVRRLSLVPRSPPSA